MRGFLKFLTTASHLNVSRFGLIIDCTKKTDPRSQQRIWQCLRAVIGLYLQQKPVGALWLAEFINLP